MKSMLTTTMEIYPFCFVVVNNSKIFGKLVRTLQENRSSIFPENGETVCSALFVTEGCRERVASPTISTDIIYIYLGLVQFVSLKFKKSKYHTYIVILRIIRIIHWAQCKTSSTKMRRFALAFL